MARSRSRSSTAPADPLAAFSAATRNWFEASFAAPTPAQAQAWPAIASGEHVLLSAPTGSGKTLAAFLWAIDRLALERHAGASGPVASGGPRTGGGDRPNGVPYARAGGVRVVYVSPLKALSYDIERNLRAPLRGIGADVSVAIRTGDTTQAERAAMARRPPEILITTPESLYLILGSRARSILGAVQAVIVDEIHAVAATKRGAHLALTLERLDEYVREGDPAREVQRVGLSATQRPLAEIGRFLVGPARKARIVDAGTRKPLDLRIEVPVESMIDPSLGSAANVDPLEPLVGGEPTHNSIWPAIYPELLSLVRAHRSTIVFVNNRRSAERVALRLNELAAADHRSEPRSDSEDLDGSTFVPVSPQGQVAPSEIARAHHGSLSREERTTIEELLKAGQLPCLVATSSLELGIDMGAVDLVLQIESPKSVASGLQRIGRAGHGVGDVSKGRIFPKFRGDLLECAVVCRRMRDGAIESTTVPQNALDVLAQQIVAVAAAAEIGTNESRPLPERVGQAGGNDRHAKSSSQKLEQEGSVSVERLYELVRATHSYAELSHALLENVLDMLDGRWASSEFAELRPRIVWDRVAATIRARRGARQLAIANAGTIPDRGLYSVTLPDGKRVGELDEEMVYEARAGQVFMLGASSWRIEEIGRDRVIVTPAPGAPGAVPFWKGDSIGRPAELGQAVGEFARWAVDQSADVLAREYDLDERAASNLLDYLRSQQAATQALPSDRTIVLERFRDEIGDWRLCVLSPYGGRVHAAWGLAISARVRERFGIDPEALWSDDGIVLRLPDAGPDPDVYSDAEPDADADADADSGDDYAGAFADSASLADLVAIDPTEVEQLVVAELGSSALFGARFRENAGRSLLIPRAYPGRRTPLWQQRLKSQALLEVARRYPDFPIVLETYRECLRDVLDLPALQGLLAKLATREVSLVEVDTPTASPFAGSLLFDYVATYMYEGDTPAAERRAAALSLDRDLLRELLGQDELRELIDPTALAQVEDDLQRRSPRAQATSADELCEVLRAVGDLSEGEIVERVLSGLDAPALLAALERDRRVARVRLASGERVIAADDAGLYRDALGAPTPAGLPAAFLEPVPDALIKLVARYARTHGPFTFAELRSRYSLDLSSVLRELEQAGEIVQGELRPGGSEREWCHVEVLRRLRRASLAALRREIEPVDARALSAFMPSWQGLERYRPGSSGASAERLREVLVPLQGLALPATAWESSVLPARCGSYSPIWLDALCASGELVWVGAGALSRDSGRLAFYFREDAPLLGPPPVRSKAAPSEPEHELLRARLAGSPCFFADLIAELELPLATLTQALWDLVWAGEVTNDAFAPLRAPRVALAPQLAGAVSHGARAGRRFGGGSLRSARRGMGAQVQGRWSLSAPIFGLALPSSTDGLAAGGVSPIAPSAIDPSASAALPPAPAPPAIDPRERRRAVAELLLERYGVLTREQVAAEGIPGGFAAVYGALGELETLGVCRRGYFVEGLGGAQFALPGAVERLRSARPPSQGQGQGSEPRALVLAAVDPAQPLGAALPWPRREVQSRRPARVAGAHVAFVDAQPVLYLERGARSILTFDAPHASLPVALGALADAVRAGRVPAIALERIDGAPAIGSPLEPLLIDLGFRSGPRRLTLRA